jgi:1-acyl-sn-glycerol-3-phosphate acyltransferase
MRSSEIAHPGPTANIVLYWIGWLWFKIFGWKTVGEPPQHTHGVIIAAPHTSNWDLPHMLAAAWLFRLRISWMGKHSLFRFPFAGFLRSLGGLQVDRRAAHGVVREVARSFETHERLFLAVPPSGTRGHKNKWKSGFYWISSQAGVPVVAGYLNYKRKEACLGFSFVPTGDVKADMDKLRGFYEGIEGKFPKSQNTIVLKEELRLENKDAE